MRWFPVETFHQHMFAPSHAKLFVAVFVDTSNAFFARGRNEEVGSVEPVASSLGHPKYPRLI